MAYEKQTWNTGDTITAEKLNHMEEGITGAGGGALIVNKVFGESSDYLDKTYAEIKSAMMDGKTVLVMYDASFDDAEYGETNYTFYPIEHLYEKVETGTETPHESFFEVYVNTQGISERYSASSEDGTLQFVSD